MYSTRGGMKFAIDCTVLHRAQKWNNIHRELLLLYYSCRNSHVGCHLLLFEKHDTTLRRLLPDNFYVRNLYRTLRNSAASPRRQHPPRRRFPADASDAHPRRSSRGNASFWEADSFVPPAAPPVRRTPEPQLPRSKTHLMIIGLTQGGCGREVGKLAKRDL